MAENLFGKIDSRGSTPVTYNFTPLSTAEAFSTSKSYAVGDYCFYGGDLYKCIASKSAGAWSPTEFEEANLGNDVANLKEDINKASQGLVYFKTISNKYINPTNGAYFTNAAYTATDYILCNGLTSIKVYSEENTPYGAWYNSSKERIASLSISNGSNLLSVPNNAAYFATSTTTENITAFKVYTPIGEKLSELVPINTLDGSNVEITENKYVNYENGNVGDSSGDCATDKIFVAGGVKYKLVLAEGFSSVASRGLAFYNDGGFISGMAYTANQTEYIIDVPNTANQLALTAKLSSAQANYFTLTAIENLSDLNIYVKAVVNAQSNSENFDVFAFNSIGVIGDSLASGCSNYKDQQDVWHVLQRKAFSWGKFIEKRTGVPVTLFARGGMTSRLWFTNENGYPKAQQNPCECYYIGLGINDYTNLGANYLGTVSDIHVGNEDTNADTFYGNYSKIIGKLKIIQPRCKIFCFTMAGNVSASETRLAYDTAIRTIVDLYDNVYLLDLSNDTFFTSDVVSSTFYGAHYLAVGYSMIASHIVDITNQYILENLEEFDDIQWIANNYPNPDE